MPSQPTYALDTLTERVIWCIITVHQTLGPGFPESVYRNALVIELGKRGLTSNIEHYIGIVYKGHPVGRHILDLLVDGQLIVEVKAVESLGKAHYAQVRSYLKATGLERALLVNFAGPRADFRRVEARPGAGHANDKDPVEDANG